MLNVCQTTLQRKSPLKSNIEKGGGEGNKSMVKCDNLPTKLAKVVDNWWISLGKYIEEITRRREGMNFIFEW